MPETRETILATFLTECAAAFTKATEARDRLAQQEAAAAAPPAASLAPEVDCSHLTPPPPAAPAHASLEAASPASLAAVRYP